MGCIPPQSSKQNKENKRIIIKQRQFSESQASSRQNLTPGTAASKSSSDCGKDQNKKGDQVFSFDSIEEKEQTKNSKTTRNEDKKEEVQYEIENEFSFVQDEGDRQNVKKGSFCGKNSANIEEINKQSQGVRNMLDRQKLHTIRKQSQLIKKFYRNNMFQLSQDPNSASFLQKRNSYEHKQKN